jgi:hypothetical protein
MEEKIHDALYDKVKNLKTELYNQLYEKLKLMPEINTSVIKMKNFVSKFLNLPENGKYSQEYWLNRGWSEGEAYVQSKKYVQKNKISAYSREFWISKINPKTGINYSIEEADFERNSRRPIRKEYWLAKGFTEEDAIKKAKLQHKNNSFNSAKTKNKNICKITSKRCKEYWLAKGFTEEDAIKEISKIQITFSLEKCIKKYGKTKGKEVWLARQEKWHNSYKKSNFSKVSQELFWNIVEKLNNLNDIYFAQLNEDKQKDISGKNNEKKLKLDCILLPDFLDISQKKIIEFNGDYWHNKIKRGNQLRDSERIEMFEKFGYKVLVVNEKEYYKNKEGIIQQCLTFLQP